MDHREMFICNNYRFRGDWGKVGPVENYVKNILKNLKTKKNFAKNIDHRQIFICNDRDCILIHNLDGLRHVKDVTNPSRKNRLKTIDQESQSFPIVFLNCAYTIEKNDWPHATPWLALCSLQ